MALGVLPDEHGQLNQRQLAQQVIEPQLRALTTRRQITAVASPRIAIAHRNDRDARFVVENIFTHPHPRAQTLTARIVPGNASFVHARSRRLSDDENTRRCRGAQHRAWTERQMRFARTAIAHGRQQRFERWILWRSQRFTLRRTRHKLFPGHRAILSDRPRTHQRVRRAFGVVSDALEQFMCVCWRPLACDDRA